MGTQMVRPTAAVLAEPMGQSWEPSLGRVLGQRLASQWAALKVQLWGPLSEQQTALWWDVQSEMQWGSQWGPQWVPQWARLRVALTVSDWA